MEARKRVKGKGNDTNSNQAITAENEHRDNDTTQDKEVKKASGWKFDTVLHHELPSFLSDNEFLLRGHRPQLENIVDCFKSVFRIHTETGNIWTHLLGCAAFFVMMVYYVCQPHPEVDWQQKVVFVGFFLGAIICMGCSTVYHVVLCQSHKMQKMCAKVDYCGIIFLIVLSFPPWVYFGFYCQLFPQVLYMSIVIILGFICMFVVSQDRFGRPELRGVRAALFICLGLTGLLPGIHYILKPDGEVRFYSWLILMAVLYIVGGVIYAVRIPERIWPGKFDILGQSHQILHMCVVAAAIACFHGSHTLSYHVRFLDCKLPDEVFT